jgi:hypothetical protein
MNSSWSWYRAMRRPYVSNPLARGAAIFFLPLTLAAHAATPSWLTALATAELPPHDEKANAVVLYSETVLTVQADGRMKDLHRVAYKILRPDGTDLGTVRIHFDSQSRVTQLRAWCIPTTGKHYEVKERDAVETAMYGIANGELASDVRTKVLRIPASTVGSIIGYQYEYVDRPYMKNAEWGFQKVLPVAAARYTLEIPAGWTYKSTWLNYPEQQPTGGERNRWSWSLDNVPAIRIESNMPPWTGVAGRMAVALVPPNGRDSGLQSWRDIGNWYLELTRERRNATADIKRQVAELTAAAPTLLEKMRALADFAQNNIRYVAIELGIGGHQPHRAEETFANRYGDCKDKVTLLAAMLKELGVESHYVIINTERGAVTAGTPPNLGFNHVVIAIVLPTDLSDAGLLAQAMHPKLGKLLYFDPTDTLTPLGRLGGALQDNFGLLVTADGSELVQLPKLPTSSNSVERSAQLTLDEQGTLRGKFNEKWLGDPGATQRAAASAAAQIADRIKPVEAVAANAFASFSILEATMANLRAADKPFEWRYAIEAPNYAKRAGDLLLVRPRVLGSKSNALLEKKEPRVHAFEFDRPQIDKDVFEIELPAGYVVDELPRPIDIDEGFASYRSKTELVGGKLRYTRTLEIKELSVPASKAGTLQQFFRTIYRDEESQAVLKRKGA